MFDFQSMGELRSMQSFVLQIERSPPLFFPGLPSPDAVFHQNKNPKNRLVFHVMLCIVV